LDSLNEEAIDSIPMRLKLLQEQNVQYIFNGNAHQALPAFVVTLNWIEKIFDPIFGYENYEYPKFPKKKVRRRLDAVSTRIEGLDIDAKDIEDIISQIQQAHETAENLPADLLELNQARKEVKKTFNQIDQLAQKAKASSKLIKDQAEEASKLLKDSEDTYSIAVTKGLAGAFHSRAKKLTFFMWVWVAGLLGALYFALETGRDRFKTLTDLITAESPDIDLMLIQLTFSIISLGAPIWFAWLSTKQIGQNSKLAEDYNFKAAMAKAYEGYRREAARIDPVMEAKLLYSALNRLDEAPLRYVGDSYHASPWQELISTTEFQKAMEDVPELKGKFLDIINRSLPEKFKS
jgi:hypothetical protein